MLSPPSWVLSPSWKALCSRSCCHPGVHHSQEPSSLSALPYSLLISGPSLWLAVASPLRYNCCCFLLAERRPFPAPLHLEAKHQESPLVPAAPSLPAQRPGPSQPWWAERRGAEPRQCSSASSCRAMLCLYGIILCLVFLFCLDTVGTFQQ